MCFAQSILRHYRQTSFAGNVGVSCKGTASAVNQGGIVDYVFLFVPDRADVLSGAIISSLTEMLEEYFYGGIHDGLKGPLFGKKRRDTQKE